MLTFSQIIHLCEMARVAGSAHQFHQAEAAAREALALIEPDSIDSVNLRILTESKMESANLNLTSIESKFESFNLCSASSTTGHISERGNKSSTVASLSDAACVVTYSADEIQSADVSNSAVELRMSVYVRLVAALIPQHGLEAMLERNKWITTAYEFTMANSRCIAVNNVMVI